MTNSRKTVLYTGMTNDLKKRVWEHQQKIVKGFTNKYNCSLLIYYETCDDFEAARDREHQIKKYSREKKINLIESSNPNWQELQI